MKPHSLCTRSVLLMLVVTGNVVVLHGQQGMAQNPADLTLAFEDGFENVARVFGVLKCSRDQIQIARIEIFQLRTELEIFFLHELKSAHHQRWILLKESRLLRMQLFFATNEFAEIFFLAAWLRKKAKQRAEHSR